MANPARSQSGWELRHSRMAMMPKIVVASRTWPDGSGRRRPALPCHCPGGRGRAMSCLIASLPAVTATRNEDHEDGLALLVLDEEPDDEPDTDRESTADWPHSI